MGIEILEWEDVKDFEAHDAVTDDLGCWTTEAMVRKDPGKPTYSMIENRMKIGMYAPQSTMCVD